MLADRHTLAYRHVDHYTSNSLVDDELRILCTTGNETVPKIIVNDTVKFLLKLQSAFW